MSMKKIYRSILRTASVFLFLLITLSAYAQQRHIVTGTIKDAGGNPMPGVNVLLKGTTIGVATDVGGKFSIEANDEDILVISFIGYKSQEIRVGVQTSIDIQMEEDVSTLSEVVVVGYGEMKRTDLSSAQVSIGANDIQKTVNTTLDQAIQGRAAGVYVTQNTGQPGGGVSVTIRGVSSITGNTEPLYVIDGVQIQQTEVIEYGNTSSSNPLAGINPSDIATIEILQGPSATAIYGSRGTNGVVLITTKRGKAGETKVNYGFSYSVQDVPKTIPVMNLRQFAQMTNDIHQITGGTSPVEFSNPELLGPGTDWQDALFNRAPLSKHQLSLSGGSDKTTFYLSGEYFDQAGVAIGSSFKRGSVRLNIDNQMRKWLKLGMNISYNHTQEKLTATQENTILNALQLAPNIPVKNPDGTWGGADDANGQSVQYTPLNPVAIANLVQNTNKRGQVLGGVNADVTILKGLVFKTSFSTNIGFSDNDKFTPTYQLGDKTNDQANLQSKLGNSFYWNWNQLLQYNLKIGKHDIGIMVSHEAQKDTYRNVGGEKTGFVTNEIPDLNVGDNLGAKATGGRGTWTMESYFGRVNYSFNDKYIVQGAIRRDGSVNFGPNNKWGFFPSASAAWRISQEPFMQSVVFINELKLRVETGVTGNQSGSYYGPLKAVSTPWGSGFILSTYGNEDLQWEETSTNNLGLNVSVLDSRVQLEVDVYIKKTNNLLLQNPLPDYLGTNAEGSIGAPTVNFGSLENKGWAFSINTVNVDKGGFTWNSNFNMSGFKTKVTEFYASTAFVDRVAWYQNDWTQRAQIGMAPWQFRGYVYDGLFQTVDEVTNSPRPVNSSGVKLDVDPGSVWVGDIKYKDINNDGIIDDQDQTNIGNPWPKFTFGFTNTFSFKGFDLSILLTGSYGNKLYNYLRFSNVNPNNINVGKNMMAETYNYARIEGEGNDAHLANPGTDVPRLAIPDQNGNGTRFTDKFVEDGSYIRIKNITLGYSLPKAFLAKQNVIQGVRLTAGIQNLKTFTRYKGYDPEVGAFVGASAASDTQSIGLDFGRYPLTPVYTFSIGVDF